MSVTSIARLPGALVFCLFLAAGAPRTHAYEPPPLPRLDREEFMVMTYNIRQFAYTDRDKDGQVNDFKPEEEVRAVLNVIAYVRPQILAVEEMGSPSALDKFVALLKERKLVYPHVEYLKGNRDFANMAVLSQFPITARLPVTNETYTMGETVLPVSRGFIQVDIQVSPTYQFRLFTAHLKSKVFNPLGQTEMRRNEARLLNKVVRHAMDENTNRNIMVVGDMNDTWGSDAIDEVVGKRKKTLLPVQAADAFGDRWTHFYPQGQAYERIDYIFVNKAMLPEVVVEKSFVVRHPDASIASDHRPVVAVIRARESGP